jgi:formyl-CoA transferase
MWQRMCEALDAPELMKRPEYASAAERLRHRDELNADIEAATVKHTSKKLVEKLNEAGVPTGPIYAINEVFADAQVQHLKIAQTVKAKDRSVTLVGQPVTLSRTPSKLVTPPPRLGEHTNAVLKEFGFSAKQIAELRRAGAI